jgi:hypothetical protein
MWMNLSNFYHYLIRLNAVLDPSRHIVMRGHANQEGLKRHYFHGGCGWLLSRGYIQYHVSHGISLEKLNPKSRYHQDDTSQSIIARKIFPKAEYWNEPATNGFQCDQCDDPIVKQQMWERLPDCPNERIAVRVTDLISLHTVSYTSGINTLIRVMSRAPPWVVLYSMVMEQRAIVCRATSDTKIFDPLGPRENVLLEEKDLPNPLINYETLPDEND